MTGETYCGKSCADCVNRQPPDCPGCRSGPGVRPPRCEIAQCCLDKDHTDCQTCTRQDHCPTRNRRDDIPRLRQARRDAENQRKRENRERAPVLYRWLRVLFWLFLPQILAGLLTEETVMARFPALRITGVVLGVLCGLLYALGLWQMRRTHLAYGQAAVCQLVLALLYGGTYQLDGGFATLLELMSLAVALASLYLECLGHAEVTEPTDHALAEQWRRLWRWNLRCLASMAVSVVLALMTSLLGLLILLAATIGLVVLNVKKLILLYQTAGHFRMFCES